MEKSSPQTQATPIILNSSAPQPQIIYADLALMEASIEERQGTPSVHIWLNFCDQLWIQIPSRILKTNRHVRIGIKNARLQLRIKNGEIPLSKRGLCHDFHTSIQVQKEETGSSERNINLKLNLEASTKSGAGLDVGSKKLLHHKSSFQESLVQTKAAGSNTNPYWIIMAKTQLCLDGRLQADLGEISIENKHSPCYVTLELSSNCPAEDICIRQFKDVWPKEATKARQWILRRVIEKELAPKLAAVLCRQELTYG